MFLVKASPLSRTESATAFGPFPSFSYVGSFGPWAVAVAGVSSKHVFSCRLDTAMISRFASGVVGVWFRVGLWLV